MIVYSTLHSHLMFWKWILLNFLIAYSVKIKHGDMFLPSLLFWPTGISVIYWMTVIISSFNARYIFIRVADFKHVNFFVNFIKSSISEKSLFSLAVVSSCFWSTCWKAKPNDTAYTIPAGARKQAIASLMAGCVRFGQRKFATGL